MQNTRIPFALPDIGEEEIDAATTAMRSGWLSSGPLVAQFERNFGEVCGPEVTAVAVSSATAGLHLALAALGIGPGAEVLVPTWTFTATAEVVVHVGAVPVFVDVDPVTLQLDLADAARKVTDRTAAVMPVHFAGRLMSPGRLHEFAETHNLAVVEDAAHAFPARAEGVSVGSGRSDATVFSFYATKTLTTGEGGMVVTRDPALAQRVRSTRLHGLSRGGLDRHGSRDSWRYDVTEAGWKYNLTDPAAAMGLVQLGRAESMRARREEIARRYTSAFADLPLGMPPPAEPSDLHSWHLFVVRLPLGTDRGDFIQTMSRLGIECSVHFIPLHRHTHWRQQYGLTDAMFPVATAEFSRVASLPIFSAMTDDQVDRVITTVHKVIR